MLEVTQKDLIQEYLATYSFGSMKKFIGQKYADGERENFRFGEVPTNAIEVLCDIDRTIKKIRYASGLSWTATSGYKWSVLE